MSESLSESIQCRNEGIFCKLLMLGNKKNVPRDKNGLKLVPEVSVMPAVRAIKIITGCKGFLGIYYCITAEYGIKKGLIK